MTDEPKGPRFGGVEGKRRGGQIGGKWDGPRKARSPEQARAAVQVRYARERARAQAYAELLDIAREIGAFLDSLALVDNSLAEAAVKLSDRLYTAVSNVKERLTKD